MGERQIYVEYMPLEHLLKLKAKKNPKLHRLDELEGSFRRFGFTMPPMLDEQGGNFVAGHGRLDGLLARKAAGKTAPDGVDDRGDDWYVPVLRGVRFRDAKEAAAYLLADNRVGEIGGYDDVVLGEIAALLKDAEEGLEGTGWTEGEIEERMRREADRLLGSGSGGGAEVAAVESVGEDAGGSGDNDAEPPADFPEYNEDIPTEHKCPKCGYAWSGKAA